MMPRNLLGLHFAIEKKEIHIWIQNLVSIITEKQAIYAYFIGSRLLLNSKESINKFPYDINAINKLWKVSLLK